MHNTSQHSSHSTSTDLPSNPHSFACNIMHNMTLHQQQLLMVVAL
jgi:hypothetical protein